MLRSSFGSLGKKKEAHLSLEDGALGFQLGELGTGELGEVGVVECLAIIGDVLLERAKPAPGEHHGLHVAALLVDLLQPVAIGEDFGRAEKVLELGVAPFDRFELLLGEHQAAAAAEAGTETPPLTGRSAASRKTGSSRSTW